VKLGRIRQVALLSSLHEVQNVPSHSVVLDIEEEEVRKIGPWRCPSRQ
jgi:hypothetical protein